MISARRPIGFAFAIVSLVGLFCLLGTGANAGLARSMTAKGDISQITWAIPEAIRGLDYTHSADGATATVVSLGMEPLVRYDVLGRLTPALATSFSTPNPTTYVYNLRKGVTFWDGKPLTTADVIYSLEQSANKKAGSQIASFYSQVKSIEATGSNQVTVKLTSPNPFFRYSIAVTPIGEKAYWSAHLKDIGTPGVLNMGTGPFVFTSFTAGQNVSLTRNDHYWGKEPAAAKVVINFITDPATLLLAVRSGQVDGTFDIPQEQIDQYKKLSNVNVMLAPELRTAYLSARHRLPSVQRHPRATRDRLRTRQEGARERRARRVRPDRAGDAAPRAVGRAADHSPR